MHIYYNTLFFYYIIKKKDIKKYFWHTKLIIYFRENKYGTYVPLRYNLNTDFFNYPIPSI